MGRNASQPMVTNANILGSPTRRSSASESPLLSRHVRGRVVFALEPASVRLGAVVAAGDALSLVRGH